MSRRDCHVIYNPRAITIDYCTSLIITLHRAQFRERAVTSRDRPRTHAMITLRGDIISERVSCHAWRSPAAGPIIRILVTVNGKRTMIIREPRMIREEVYSFTTRLRITRSSTYRRQIVSFPRIFPWFYYWVLWTGNRRLRAQRNEMELKS